MKLDVASGRGEADLAEKLQQVREILLQSTRTAADWGTIYMALLSVIYRVHVHWSEAMEDEEDPERRIPTIPCRAPEGMEAVQ